MVSETRDLPLLRRLVVLSATASAPIGHELTDGACQIVTRALLLSASRRNAWTLVPVDVSLEALDQVSSQAVVTRAGKLAAEFGADAALTARVFAFRERIGSEYGVTEPASVSVRVFLVAPHGEQPIWQANYSETQQPLAYNLLNLWSVSHGAKWLTASELTTIGVDEAIDRLAAASR